MKSKEFITESVKLKEKAPVGVGKQVWSAVKGAFGSAKGKADADVGARASQIYQKFNDYALRAGMDMSNMPVAQLKKWFTTQGLVFPKNVVGTNTALDLTNKDTSNQFWTGAAQQAYAKGNAGGAKLGSSYGLPNKPAKKKAASAAQNTKSAPAPAAGGTDFNSLKAALAGAKGNLHPNQINALIQTLTNP